jgi:ParB family chromosome partitioning protein
MSAQKRGLGRGLDALLGPERAGNASSANGLVEIRVDAIRPNPRQPRKTFEPAALAELEQSIRELGVLVPILVRPVPIALGERPAYELIAGERRWRAAAAARLETVPAIVREADDRSSLEVAVVENLQRADLDALEEAMGFAHLIEEYGYTQERLAERIGKSRPAVANALRLLNLSDPIKALVRSGALSVGHARALLAVDASERQALAERIVRDRLTVRDVERLGERRRSSTPTPPPRRSSPDRDALEARLRYALGAPVAIVGGTKGGRIEIRYADEGDLGRIVEALLPDAP